MQPVSCLIKNLVKLDYSMLHLLTAVIPDRSYKNTVCSELEAFTVGIYEKIASYA